MAGIARNSLALVKKVITDLSQFEGDFSELKVLPKDDADYIHHTLNKELTRLRYKLIHMSVMLLTDISYSEHPIYREINSLPVFEEPTYSQNVGTAHLAGIWEMYKLPSNMMKMFVLRQTGLSFTETCDTVHSIIHDTEDDVKEKVQACVLKNFKAVLQMLFSHTRHVIEISFDDENVGFTFHWNSV